MRQVKALTWTIVLLTFGILLFNPHPKTASATLVPAVTITQPGIDSHSGMIPYAVFGFQFEPTIDIYVTQLGMFDAGSDGLVNTHWVGLWSDSGTLLSSVELTHADPGTLSAGFRYMDISSLLLEAGHIYRIAVDYAFGDSEDHSDSDILPLDTHLFNPDIIWLDTASDGAATAGLTFPSGLGATTGNQLSSILGPNFQFEPVPEPATMLLLGSGLLGLWGARRKFKK